MVDASMMVSAGRENEDALHDINNIRRKWDMKRNIAILVALALIMAVSFGLASENVVNQEQAALREGVWVDTANRTISVSLIENGSTGYTWTLDAPDDQAVVAVVDEQIVSSNADQAVGAPSLHTWTMALNGAGEATLTFQYARTWEDKTPLKTITVTVTLSETGELAVQTAGWQVVL